MFHFLFRVLAITAALTLAGCAAPGEPQPKHPPVPQAVGDLAAHQTGESVLLTFTLPKKTIEGDPLAEPPAVEIYRGTQQPGGAPGKVSTRLVYTIPGALADTYLNEGRFEFSDPLKAEELGGAAGNRILYMYMVRTRASKRRASADSNVAAVQVYAVPAAITDVRARVTENAVELTWPAPTRASGSAGENLAGYRVYRAEVEPGAQTAAQSAKPKMKTPLQLLAPAAATEFRDTQFEFGRTYLYIVRSVAQYESASVESGDSQPLVVTPRDIFPPAEPAGLVVVVVPAMPGAAAHIELSWEISPETDLAGYHVYRSEGSGARGERLTQELLLTPTFRDMSAVPGRRYTYRVSAVDRAGNESPLSAVVTAEVPQP